MVQLLSPARRAGTLLTKPSGQSRQRRFSRHVFSNPLLVTRTLPPNEIQKVPGAAMEISEGGLSAIITADLKVGESVEASFEMQPGQRMTVHGAVRNKAQFRYGLEFLDLREDLRMRIKKACESLPLYTGGWY